MEDLANGSMIALEEKTKNKIITLASEKNIKIVDLAKTIIKLTKSRSKIVFNKKNKRLDDFTSNYYYNRKDKKALINWRPKYDLKNGLREYIKVKRELD